VIFVGVFGNIDPYSDPEFLFIKSSRKREPGYLNSGSRKRDKIPVIPGKIFHQNP